MSASAVATARKLFTDRINRIEVSATMAITAEAGRLKAEGVELVDFGAGEPHFATPRHIKDAAIDAIEKNFTRYTAVQGLPDVRKAIVERHAEDFGTNYAPDEAVFTTGGKLAIFNLTQALIEHGDEVIIPVPYWVSYKDIVQYAGGVPVFLETAESENFRVTAKAIESLITPRTKAIILNTPSNPSGSVIAKDDLFAIVRMAHERGIYLYIDECYVYLQFEGEMVSGASILEAKEHVIVMGSLSKTYAMTGWRAGYALGPKPIIAAMSKLQSQSTSNTATFVQKASVAALTSSQACVAEMRADYQKLRDRILARLAEIPGITCTKPEGAFYVYPNVAKYLGRPGGPATTIELAKRLLTEARVVAVPGEAFGTNEHIRLSYAVSHDAVEEGTKRMREWFATLA
ncbi:pyridoxal phosphate-dependent aminotransferase [Acidipila sp. EB88]|uniref:pyridoxal phosphate-dependent aminotransferase n=1 Tax=Acidipila sp. EB88 TaxID=2305226 RepID=UPI000F5DE4C0|nr:pyridoxal phosphate-dependent aminotransferase [Acidipila sp. EB88]RRA48910.1 pyridoxal phosphate-dependent aminotransferase [Acidipila sp. EB88]